MYPIHFMLIDEQTDQLLYDNQEDKFIESVGLGFDVSKTIRVKITVLARESTEQEIEENIGCVGVLVQYKNYPFKKENSDLDIPLPDGIPDADYLGLLEQHLPKLIDQVKPDFIFFQSGVDILNSDKLGKLGVSIQGCRTRDEMVFDQCVRHGIPLQVSMGGGYSPKIADIVEAHANTYRLAMSAFT
jgi:hypothetical protein